MSDNQCFDFFLINCSLKNIHYEGFFTIIKFYKFFEYSLPFYLQTLTDYTISESGYQWLSFRQTVPNCPHESMILYYAMIFIKYILRNEGKFEINV